MNRRRFLKLLLSSSLAAGTGGLVEPFSFFGKASWAYTGKSLVVIFQRGGCDGLNLCVPYGDDYYFKARPTLAISPPGGGKENSALDLNGFFGFHPRMMALHNLFNEGQVAIFPAVHYPNASRSHFDSEIIIESGSDKKLYSGWLNRYLNSTNDLGMPMRAVGIGSRLVHALKGEAPVSVMDNLSSFGLGSKAFQKRLRTTLRSILTDSSNSTSTNLKLANSAGLVMLDDLDLMEQLQGTPYTPENGAEYPGGTFGRQLQLIARLIKAGLGLEVACVDTGGWDTHSQQAGRQASRIEELSKGLTAFYKDLGDRSGDVLTLTMTEFGRTVRENASRGTDHGNASTWMAIGALVKGGIYGEWPGLKPEQLYLGRYLAYTVDFRNILAEVLLRHLGCQDVASVLPDFEPKPLGFL